ncbi:unnamed protein product [Peniophora sp. CBMAI 1063]|nr:unnamed protein product [Peniophora sp. CBMAI 1063]
MPDPTKSYRVECDVSDFAISAMLSQHAEDNDWHLVAYLSHALTTWERNYDTHDKELLAIIHALEDWCHYLEGSLHQVEIFTNHKNLKYFTTAQKLNRRQARQRILDTDTKDQEVTAALRIIEEEGPAALKHKLVGWEQKDGLLIYNARHFQASTGKSPFELLYGFTPCAYPQLNPTTCFSHLRDRLRHLESVCEEAQASLQIAAELMKDRHGVPEATYKLFKVGDKVWLEGKDLKSVRPKAKLNAKQHGPFTVTEVLSNLETAINFRLDIPKTWKRIHSVFHTHLLTPYMETPEHGPNYTEEPPELVDDKEEYVVEAILNG